MLLALQGLSQSNSSFEVTAKIVLEDGSAIHSAPMISLLVPGAEDLCLGREFFLDGTLRLQVPHKFIHGERQIGCQISVQLTGYAPFTGPVADGSVIRLRRAGPQHESGASVSAVRLNIPDDARKEYELGEAALAKKKLPKAEEHFKAALSLYPRYALAWSELGQTFDEQQRLPEALDAFEKARAADPSYAKALVQLCLAYGAQNRWDEQRQTGQAAIKMNAIEFPSAYYCSAEADFHNGKLDDAERATRQSLRIDPNHPYLESLVLLGQIFEKQGNSRDAVTEYKNYLEMAPHGPKAAAAKEGLARCAR